MTEPICAQSWTNQPIPAEEISAAYSKYRPQLVIAQGIAAVAIPDAVDVHQRGPRAQDQDRQAGYDGGDRPRHPCHPGLGHQVVGDCPACRARRSRSPTTWRTGGRCADHLVSGQPDVQRVRRVGFDADREGDGGAQVRRGPDARQRGDRAEPGHLRDSGPPGPHLGRSRDGQDQQRPGPDSPARPDHRGGPVRGDWSADPRRDRATLARVGGGGTRRW